MLNQYPTRVLEAKSVVLVSQRASVSLLQRELEINFTEAAELMGELQVMGVVTPGLDGVRRLAPTLENKETGVRARYVRAVYETVRFFWDMWEEECDGHTESIALIKPAVQIGNVSIRNLVLNGYFRKQDLSMIEAAMMLAEELRGNYGGLELTEHETDDLAIMCTHRIRPFERVTDSATVLTRACARVARHLVLRRLEGENCDTRCFETFITDSQIVIGQGRNGGTEREHVVPLVFLRDRCAEAFTNGASLGDISAQIQRCLALVLITKQERKLLDDSVHAGGMGWKETMPADWCFETGDPYARLREAGIGFDLPGYPH